MNCLRVLLSVLCTFPLGACLSIRIGTRDCPAGVSMGGLASGYVTANALHAYDGTILRLGIFTDTERDGEILSFDLWPLFGFGVGLVGARVRVLPFEAAAGVLFYTPEPEPRCKVEVEPEPPKADEPPPEKTAS